MNILIAKLGAAGDVVRTTPLLRRLEGQIHWLTAAKNTVLLDGVASHCRPVAWEQRDRLRAIEYDLIVNLEDTLDVGLYLNTLEGKQRFGAYVDSSQTLRYTDDSRRWFDLSLISRYGYEEANRLKWLNRHTYQELLFDGLRLRFGGEPYLLPEPTDTNLAGDIAIAPEAGPEWPMKNWAYYDVLKQHLEAHGLTVNVLPRRPTLLEHLGDVGNHRCVVGGDSLPMHVALGTGTPCVTLFTCTSPWEIHGYGVLRQIVSPLLEDFFYHRERDERATTAITVEEVSSAVLEQFQTCGPGTRGRAAGRPSVAKSERQ